MRSPLAGTPCQCPKGTLRDRTLWKEIYLEVKTLTQLEKLLPTELETSPPAVVIPIQNSLIQNSKLRKPKITRVWECVSVAFFFQIGVTNYWIYVSVVVTTFSCEKAAIEKAIARLLH